MPRFTLVMLLVVLFGVVIRFACLDQKVYWFDEGVTSIHVRGYTSSEMGAELIQRGPIAPADFAPYESLVDETDRDWSVLGEYNLFTQNPTKTMISILMTQGYRMPTAPPLDTLVRITR